MKKILRKLLKSHKALERVKKMKCRLCGNKLTIKEYRKHICKHCMEQLPKCLQDGIHRMDEKEAKRLCSKFHPRDSFNTPELHNMWIRYGDVGLTTRGVMIDRTHVILFEDIDSFFFDFLPREARNGNLCKGEFCFGFRLHNFPYEFRTLMVRCVSSYEIKNGNFFPNFCREIYKMAEFIQKGITFKTHNLADERKKYEKEEQERFCNSFCQDKKKEEKKKEWGEKGERHSYENKSTRKQNITGDELKDALSFFQMKIPYTNTELKRVYRSLIVQCHPDQKVKRKDLKPEDVNRYYGILKRYVS